MLLLPLTSDKEQLNALACVSRILRNSELVRKLRRSRDSEDLFRAMVIDNGNSRE
jgi:mannitol/fructose-specific phosphotransferase system IIA component (Ntr-type)